MNVDDWSSRAGAAHLEFAEPGICFQGDGKFIQFRIVQQVTLSSGAKAGRGTMCRSKSNALPNRIASSGPVWALRWDRGVHDDEREVALGMASTALNIGGAIGLAVSIAIANAHTARMENVAHASAVAQGIKLAFLIATWGIIISLRLALALPSMVKALGAKEW